MTANDKISGLKRGRYGWTDHDESQYHEAIINYGRNFRKIVEHVGTKKFGCVSNRIHRFIRNFNTSHATEFQKLIYHKLTERNNEEKLS